MVLVSSGAQWFDHPELMSNSSAVLVPCIVLWFEPSVLRERMPFSRPALKFYWQEVNVQQKTETLKIEVLPNQSDLKTKFTKFKNLSNKTLLKNVIPQTLPHLNDSLLL